MTVWFTSDEHMGHANIIRHCRRPFADARDMTERLVERHNALVGPADEVWHVGDFSLS
jgi:calcineurin-like phosphoesterase family protein